MFLPGILSGASGLHLRAMWGISDWNIGGVAGNRGGGGEWSIVDKNGPFLVLFRFSAAFFGVLIWNFCVAKACKRGFGLCLEFRVGALGVLRGI